jgi:hypothetical protein
MPQITVKATAEKIAARVDADAVGFDPITIITIFSTVLPMLLKCWGKEDESDPQKVSAAIRRQHENNPVRLRRRTAIAIRRESETRMSKAQSEILADAMIAEAVEATPARVASLCSAVL